MFYYNCVDELVILRVAIMCRNLLAACWQGVAGFFTNRETRADVLMRLVNPTLDWGPAMTDDWNRYSLKRGTLTEDDINTPAEFLAVSTPLTTTAS